LDAANLKPSRAHSRAALWIPATYALGAGLWIALSDVLVGRLARGLGEATQLETAKGGLFVVVTALLLHVVLRNALRRMERVADDLADGEAQYRALIEGSPEIVVIIEHEKFVFANVSAAKALGVTSSSVLVGEPVSGYIDLADRSPALARVEAVARGVRDEATQVRRVRRQDGVTFPVETVVAPIVFQGRRCVQVIARDVTERTRLEVELHKSNLALRTLVAWNDARVRASSEQDLLDRFCQIAVETFGCRLVWIRLTEGSPSERLRPAAIAGTDDGFIAHMRSLFGNPATADSPGPTALRTGKPSAIDDIVTDPRAEHWRAEALRRGFGSALALPIVSSDGMHGFVALYAAEKSAFSGEVGEVLAQGAADLAVGMRARRARTVLESILTHAPAAIWAHDAEGRLLMGNDRFCQRTGCPSESLVGRPVVDFVPPHAAAAYFANCRLVIESRRPVTSEQSYERGDETITLELVHFPLELVPGRPPAVGVIALDASARRRAERELQRSREELRALALRQLTVREEEKGRIARDLHDDLGQLLTRLKIDARSLERAFGDAPPAAETGALIDRVVAIEELIEETLGRVKTIATSLRPGSLDALGLGAALAQEARAFRVRTGIACDASIDEAAAEQRGESATALFRIAQEALTNVTRHARASHVRLSLGLDGGDVVLRVVDDGVGIDIDAAQGGLGLVGMRERAAALCGTVAVELGPSGGTMVVARIPFAS
jgi:PAS domain S-box-containing protein